MTPTPSDHGVLFSEHVRDAKCRDIREWLEQSNDAHLKRLYAPMMRESFIAVDDMPFMKFATSCFETRAEYEVAVHLAAYSVCPNGNKDDTGDRHTPLRIAAYLYVFSAAHVSLSD